ncbi:MAG: hypothetical protein GXO56_03790 [Chloroflexi bacterium]|nr:hypothetical protein [Chloroflexota bacterium]
MFGLHNHASHAIIAVAWWLEAHLDLCGPIFFPLSLDASDIFQKRGVALVDVFLLMLVKWPRAAWRDGGYIFY